MAAPKLLKAKWTPDCAKTQEVVYQALEQVRDPCKGLCDEAWLRCIEWPRYCSYRGLQRVQKLAKDLNLREACFDGCAFGLKDQKGNLLRKPWKVLSNSPEIIKALQGKLCPGGHVHVPTAGSKTKATENYNKKIAKTVHDAFARQVQRAPSPAIGAFCAVISDSCRPEGNLAAAPSLTTEGDLWLAVRRPEGTSQRQAGSQCCRTLCPSTSGWMNRGLFGSTERLSRSSS